MQALFSSRFVSISLYHELQEKNKILQHTGEELTNQIYGPIVFGVK